jgi:hypothetical protein
MPTAPWWVSRSTGVPPVQGAPAPQGLFAPPVARVSNPCSSLLPWRGRPALATHLYSGEHPAQPDISKSEAFFSRRNGVVPTSFACRFRSESVGKCRFPNPAPPPPDPTQPPALPADVTVEPPAATPRTFFRRTFASPFALFAASRFTLLPPSTSPSTGGARV